MSYNLFYWLRFRAFILVLWLNNNVTAALLIGIISKAHQLFLKSVFMVKHMGFFNSRSLVSNTKKCQFSLDVSFI